MWICDRLVACSCLHVCTWNIPKTKFVKQKGRQKDSQSDLNSFSLWPVRDVRGPYASHTIREDAQIHPEFGYMWAGGGSIVKVNHCVLLSRDDDNCWVWLWWVGGEVRSLWSVNGERRVFVVKWGPKPMNMWSRDSRLCAGGKQSQCVNWKAPYVKDWTIKWKLLQIVWAIPDGRSPISQLSALVWFIHVRRSLETEEISALLSVISCHYSKVSSSSSM